MKKRFTVWLLLMTTVVIGVCGMSYGATLTSVAVIPDNASVQTGATVQFHAIGKFSDGYTHDLTMSAIWSSSTTSVATIISLPSSTVNGTATGVAPGSTTITASFNFVSGSISGSAALSVTPTLSSLAVTASNLVTSMNTTQKFTATGTYSDLTTKDLTTSATWTSSNPAIATVSSGVAQPVSGGTTTITASINGISASSNLTVWQFVDNLTSSGLTTFGINYDQNHMALEPQLTEFSNSLYAIWYESDDSGVNHIRVKRYDGSSWNPAEGGSSDGINSEPTHTANSPQLTVFGPALYAAWNEADDSKVYHIRVKSYDGSSWTPAEGGSANGISGPARTATSPQLTVFGSSLYAIWSEATGTIGQIRVKSYDGSSWTSVDGGGLNYDSAQSARNPQLTAFNGELYAIWQESATVTNADGTITWADQVRMRKYDGSSWILVNNGDALNYDSAKNGDRPQLTAYNNALYATWREASFLMPPYPGFVNQIRVKKYDGTGWSWADGGGATGINYSSSADGHEPQLTVLGSNMFAIWCEPAPKSARNIRVRKYDGNNWAWFDGGSTYGINYDTSGDANHQQLTVFRGQLYATWWEKTDAASQIRVSTLPMPALP